MTVGQSLFFLWGAQGHIWRSFWLWGLWHSWRWQILLAQSYSAYPSVPLLWLIHAGDLCEGNQHEKEDWSEPQQTVSKDTILKGLESSIICWNSQHRASGFLCGCQEARLTRRSFEYFLVSSPHYFHLLHKKTLNSKCSPCNIAPHCWWLQPFSQYSTNHFLYCTINDLLWSPEFDCTVEILLPKGTLN